MSNYNPQIDEYINNSAEFAQPILKELRSIIHNACPDVEEKLSWSRPHYYYKGKGMLVTDGLKERVTFGCWFDNLVYESPNLSREAKDIHDSLGFLKKVEDIPPKELLIETIHLAMKIIDEGRVIEKPKKKAPLKIPEYITTALTKDKNIAENFNTMSPSHQREYVEWIEGAKTEETKSRRLDQMLEQVKEKKEKNWKYRK